MKIAAIICEYNPMQNGHVYHLSKALKETQAERVVCIMSGNFTQRGEIAVADKYARAAWAVKNGADAVVELPPQYVLTTAKYFALGGVKIANLIKGDVVLSFGSECGDIEKLTNTACFTETQEFKNALTDKLKDGNGYAKSYCDALWKISPSDAEILSSPNNILAVEYLKSIKATGSRISAHTVERKGGDYRQTSTSALPSAFAVRQMLKNGDMSCIKTSVPDCVYDYLKNISQSQLDETCDKLFALMKFTATTKNIKSIHGLKEGIENRITEYCKKSCNLKNFLSQLQTKRYTLSYLQRTVANILIDNKYSADDLINEQINYVNVLAVSAKSKSILNVFENPITNSMRLPADSLILNSDRLYSSVARNVPQHMLIVE